MWHAYVLRVWGMHLWHGIACLDIMCLHATAVDSKSIDNIDYVVYIIYGKR